MNFARHPWLLFFSMALAASLAMLTAAFDLAQARGGNNALPPYRITALRAMLFYEDTGKFSRDVLSTPNFALWNVVIGEGSAEGASSSTLVMAEVTGAPGAYEPSRKVEVTAQYRVNGGAPKKTLIIRTTSVGILNRSGKFFVPLWLYDTGCNPVDLTARIIGQKSASAVKKTIDFRCGE